MFYLASLQHEPAADLLSLSADRLPCGTHTEHKPQGPAHFIYDASSAGGIAEKYQNLLILQVCSYKEMKKSLNFYGVMKTEYQSPKLHRRLLVI